MERLILRLGLGERFGEVIHDKHKNKSKDQSNADVSVWPFDICRYWRCLLLIFFWAMHTRVSFLMAFSGVVVTALPGLCVLLLRLALLLHIFLVRSALLVAVRGCLWGPPHNDTGCTRSFDGTSLCKIRAQCFRFDMIWYKLGRVQGSFLLGMSRGNLGLRMRDVMSVALDGGAVHGLDAFWYNYNERCAYENAGAEQ